MTDVWGPWQQHNGNGYPPEVIGMRCQVIDWDNNLETYYPPSEPFMCYGNVETGGSWDWSRTGFTSIEMYRTARPAGMGILDEVLRDVEEFTPEVLQMIDTAKILDEMDAIDSTRPYISIWRDEQ